MEQMLIALGCPVICIYRKKDEQRGYTQFPRDSRGFLNSLSSYVIDLPSFSGHGTRQRLRLRVQQIICHVPDPACVVDDARMASTTTGSRSVPPQEAVLK